MIMSDKMMYTAHISESQNQLPVPALYVSTFCLFSPSKDENRKMFGLFAQTNHNCSSSLHLLVVMYLVPLCNGCCSEALMPQRELSILHSPLHAVISPAPKTIYKNSFEMSFKNHKTSTLTPGRLAVGYC